MRSPRSIAHFSPSTVVHAPVPSTTMRTALGVWRWLGALSPGSSSGHAQVDGGAGLHLLQAVAGVGQHQHTALSLFDGRQLPGAQQQGFQRGIGPVRGLGLARRHAGRQHRAKAGPQRHQVVRGQRFAVIGGQVFQAAEFIHFVFPPFGARSVCAQAVVRPPAVEPFQRVVEALRRRATPQLVAHQAFHASGMVKPPHLVRAQHNARGARHAAALVELRPTSLSPTASRITRQSM